MKQAMERGHWVFFQNCHLAPRWMPALERLIEHIDPNKICVYIRYRQHHECSKPTKLISELK